MLKGLLDVRLRMTLRSWIARKHFVFELITMLSVLEREERWGICILGSHLRAGCSGTSVGLGA